MKKKKFEDLSRAFYIKTYIEYIAYHIYLDQKFHKRDNNTPRRIMNTCLNAGWVLNEEEKARILDEAIIIARDIYSTSVVAE